MNIYIRKKHTKLILPLTIFLLIILIFNINFYTKINFLNNNNSYNVIYLQTLPKTACLLSYIKYYRNYREFMLTHFIFVLWCIFFIFFCLITEHLKNYYKSFSFPWHLLKLRRLLMPKQHRSNYKGFLS